MTVAPIFGQTRDERGETLDFDWNCSKRMNERIYTRFSYYEFVLIWFMIQPSFESSAVGWL